MYLGINDYELLYLISEGNSKARDLMYLKYRNFILKIAHSFDIRLMSSDDLLSEGYLILTKALDTFNPSYNKTFTKYLEILLIRRYLRIKQVASRELIDFYNEDEYQYKDETLFDSFAQYKHIFSSEELAIIDYIYYKNVSVNVAAKKLGIKLSSLYKKLVKIREKFRNNLT